MESLPDCVSNGGPDRPEEPKTWRELVDEAEDSCRDARRRYDDNPVRNRELRIASVVEAIEALEQAKAILEAE